MNVNFVLAKAIQQDHLRDAKQNQVSRMWRARRKAAPKRGQRTAQK